MKKIISMMLCLFMVLSAAACGGQQASEVSNDVSSEQTEISTPDTTQPAASEEDASQSVEEPEEETPESVQPEGQPAFDPGWAGAEYEMPIPQPPFTQFSVQAPDGMFIIQSTDPAEIGALTEEDVIAYCDQLKQIYNFTNIQTEGHYENSYGEGKYGFGAATEDGLVVELDYGAGGGSVESEPGMMVLVVLPS